MARMTVRRGRSGFAGSPGVVRVDARAKLNLGLAVGPLRDDGFHELATIFQSISLHDTLLARARPRGFTLTIRHERAAVRGGAKTQRSPRGGVEEVPRGNANLVLRAARLVTSKLGLAGGADF